jgi:LL-diaminopimelate aminotransferase
VAFAERLLDPEIAVVCTPGPWVSEECEGGIRPGARYVRFAMVASLDDTRRACDAMRANKAKLLR